MRCGTDKSERQDHLCAVCLRKFPFVLLRLSPSCTDLRCLIWLAQLTHVRSHQAGVPQAVHNGECGGDHSEAQNRRVGEIIALMGDWDVVIQRETVQELELSDKVGHQLFWVQPILEHSIEVVLQCANGRLVERDSSPVAIAG